SSDELTALQLSRLRWTLKHAYENVPHYRKAFDRAGVRPEDCRTLADITRFPFTVKTEDRKSTRLNSSHVSISYAVFCLKNKNYVNAFTHIQTNTHITGSFNRLTNTPDIPPQTKT